MDKNAHLPATNNNVDKIFFMPIHRQCGPEQKAVYTLNCHIDEFSVEWLDYTMITMRLATHVVKIRHY